MKRRHIPVLWCLTAAAFFGASTPASKYLLGETGPVTLAGLLYLGAAVAMLPFSFKGGSSELRRKPEQLKKLGGAVLFGGILGPILIMLGLRMEEAASVSLWLNFETVATALLAWMIFHEHLGKNTWIAIALVSIAGVILASPSGFGYYQGALLIILGCVCWGADNNLTSIIDGYTPEQTTLAKGLVAGTVNLVLGIFLERFPPGWTPIALALVVGIFSYGLSIMLYISSAQRLGATRSQMIFASSPFFGLIISWALLGEPVKWEQVVSGLVMAFGLGILFAGHHEHPHFHQPTRHTHRHSHDDLHHTHLHPNLPDIVEHTHEHAHEQAEHTHPHEPDLHHRHDH